jgi:hypothetical protein
MYLIEHSNELLASSLVTVLAARRSRSDRRSWFVLVGHVEQVPVRAVWRRGVLFCDELWRERAAIVVDPGDEFGLPERPEDGYQASLDWPCTAVLLTLIRASSGISSVEFRFASD